MSVASPVADAAEPSIALVFSPEVWVEELRKKAYIDIKLQ